MKSEQPHACTHLVAREREHVVARHHVQCPQGQPAVEGGVGAAQLGECLLEYEHPQLALVGLREERRACSSRM